MRFPQLTYANVVSSLALFLALGGTSWALARNSVGSRELKPNAVTSAKIRNGAIHVGDLAVSARARRGVRGQQGPPGERGPAGIAQAPESWQPLALTGGWTNYGRAHQDPTFRKDQLGIVHLRGLLTRGDAPVPGPMAVLPPGYRPPSHELFSGADGGSAQVRIDIFADGSVHWNGGSASGTVSVSGISFATD